MQNQTLSQWTSKLRRTESPARRTEHGAIAWTSALGAKTLRQPQDGAPEVRSRISSITARLNGSMMFEPEDATITGGTRSLNRRLMGLNVIRADRKGPAVVSVAATQARVA
jgi:hypothetical protein